MKAILSRNVVYITFTLFLASFIFVLYILYSGKQGERYVGAPAAQTIYTFWHQEELPEFLRFCIGTWKKNNPGIQVVILNMDNYKRYVRPGFDVAKLRFGLENPTRTSDFIRMAVLEYQGGIWMDISILCRGRLEILDHPESFRGYYLEVSRTNVPNLENWCFACPAQNRFMNLWFAEVMRMNEFESVDKYVANVVEQGVDIEHIPENLQNYLACHVAAHKVLQLGAKYLQNELVLMSADGPFEYLKRVDWDAEKALESLCESPLSNKSAIVKLRGGERNLIMGNPALLKCIYSKFA